MAQWKRAGPITPRSLDRSELLLSSFFLRSHSPKQAADLNMVIGLSAIDFLIVQWTIISILGQWDIAFIHLGGRHFISPPREAAKHYSRAMGHRWHIFSLRPVTYLEQ
ncbi:hypothetical protein HYPSUDRAFT_1045559 [Hypholoma sublateritium FD-334 SS-4]|uniref:Uncharacterized protein n=1 Tax=Hypholoma sublateritium (strain FD-334 SS-4) TaxID=945553 RepID=A0A0D2NCZ8_HYPSF|nr:hypothetical protein HYPSUDRAFT_1045559 [Hypholoma sublateritium FD-334 SS-4]